MENYEDEDDVHFCIKCHATINGLENYVQHRRAGCCRLPVKQGGVQGTTSTSKTVSYPEIPNADAFFNSLELRSSAKKPQRRISRTRLNAGKKNEGHAEARIKKPRRSQTESEEVNSKALVPGKLNILPVDAELDNPTDHLSIPSLVGFPDIVTSSTGKSVATTSSSKNCTTAGSMMKITVLNYGDKQEIPQETSFETFMADDSVAKSGTSKQREVWLGDTVLVDMGTGAETKDTAHSSLSQYEVYDYVDEVDSEDECSPDEDVVEEESCSETDDADDPEYPPQGHTGGKWRPGLPAVAQMETELAEEEVELDPEDDNPEQPPPSYTGGKWEPTSQQEIAHGQKAGDDGIKDEKEPGNQPPPDHTRGKWVPGARSDRNSGFYCSPCARTLASKVVYERHLLSELHAKRSITELDGELRLPAGVESAPVKGTRSMRGRRVVASWKVQDNEDNSASDSQKQSRNRKREVIWCEMCKTWVQRPQMGKHLLSHYHCRISGVVPRSPRARTFLLDNMANIVRQSPFQCAGCRFYCNTEETFLRHWRSKYHTDAHREISSSFRCTACDVWCEDNDEMEVHVMSLSHRQVVSMMDGSVPVVITRQRRLPCDTCGQHFRYNLQLKQHVAETGHAAETASDEYQTRLRCQQCNQIFRSQIALQRHQLSNHVFKSSVKIEPYFCSLCALTFSSTDEAIRHRKSSRHKDRVEAKKYAQTGVQRKKNCLHCDASLPSIAKLKEHLLSTHIELCPRCPRCGMSFPTPQGLALHSRQRKCKFGSAQASGNDKRERSSSRSAGNDEKVVENAGSAENCQGANTAGNVEMVVAEAAGTKYSQNAKETKVLEEATNVKDWQCGKCGYTTKSAAEYIYHESLHVEKKTGLETADMVQETHQCTICPKSFKKKNNLIAHLRCHTGEKRFLCPSCNQPFVTRAKLNQHRAANCSPCSESQINDGERQRNYVCTVCQSAFHTRHVLQRHMLRHTGKKILCGLPGCPTALRTPRELKIHRERIHDILELDGPYQCPECSFRTISPTRLRRHQNYHERRRPIEDEQDGAAGKKVLDKNFYHCAYTGCEFKTKLKSHLHRHLRLHTGSKPYRCAHCPYASNNFENLRKHVLSTRIHPGKSIYECTHCDTFRTNFSRELRAHLLQKHNDNFPTPELAASHVASMYNPESGSPEIQPQE
ncbi:zinc finger protein Xfin-like isoform X1 [Neodiprion virginianus]|uniref:zinc finger protein Xfin-like isoform X1 n=1 Tax=Neodiprion virginianus TaxID=2961670 RepID=UPI001EE6FEC5|nr:zinc finger protein Xfin-like isoform X1 [Neodiprion virginianus]